MRWSSGALRDWIMFLGGLAGTAHETLVSQVDRPGLLLIYAGMMGLPAAIGADRRAAEQRGPEPQSPTTPAGSGSPGST